MRWNAEGRVRWAPTGDGCEPVVDQTYRRTADGRWRELPSITVARVIVVMVWTLPLWAVPLTIFLYGR